MKRTLLVLCLLAPVTLVGCQTIRSHNPFRHHEPAYKSAQQAQPLEVPPGMSQPPSTEALTIPNAGSGSTGTQMAGAAPGAEPQVPMAGTQAVAGTVSGNSLVINDTPASVYRRVGLALARGDAGQVTAHDDSARTYQVAVDAVVTVKSHGSFLHRMFHGSKNEVVKGSVTVSVTPSGAGSLITAQGNPDAVARVLAVLQQRLQ